MTCFPTADHSAPIAVLDFTFLIGGMLVRLVMVFLVLSAVTHEVPFDLPSPRPIARLPITPAPPGWPSRGREMRFGSEGKRDVEW